jgi:hypothetical protein
VGKSMLARWLTVILLAMTLPEALDTTRIHSVAGRTGERTACVTTRPFRAPHHTISDVGLIGGGQVPVPEEVSRPHHGVLFLDELPEFYLHLLEGLRQTLKEGITSIQSQRVADLVAMAVLAALVKLPPPSPNHLNWMMYYGVTLPRWKARSLSPGCGLPSILCASRAWRIMSRLTSKHSGYTPAFMLY